MNRFSNPGRGAAQRLGTSAVSVLHVGVVELDSHGRDSTEDSVRDRVSRRIEIVSVSGSIEDKTAVTSEVFGGIRFAVPFPLWVNRGEIVEIGVRCAPLATGGLWS